MRVVFVEGDSKGAVEINKLRKHRESRALIDAGLPHFSKVAERLCLA